MQKSITFFQKKIKTDLFFIDRGHSVKTIKSDFTIIRKIYSK